MIPEPHQELDGRVGFCVGTGRCGTTFLSELAGLEPEVASSHERLRLAATFHMFCKWHGIAIDAEGFLLDREDAIRRDLMERHFSFECSALLSHSLEELFDRFRARFLLLVRSPAETVASFAVRGWFLKPCARRDPSLPPSYREGEEPRHFLGRNIPHGAEFERWTRLTQIGKLAWFWQARTRAILEQFSRLPESHCRIVRLEDLDFPHYQDLARFMGWQSRVDAFMFSELALARPNAGPNPPRRFTDWSPLEAAEFEAEVAPVAEALGYEFRVTTLKERVNARTTASAEQPLSSLPAVLKQLSG
ncbi:MAG: sulfotransferase [Gemmataceae bacterium]|nr:sulfotransferase [Gemmataceae bacterium]